MTQRDWKREYKWLLLPLPDTSVQINVTETDTNAANKFVLHCWEDERNEQNCIDWNPNSCQLGKQKFCRLCLRILTHCCNSLLFFSNNRDFFGSKVSPPAKLISAASRLNTRSEEYVWKDVETIIATCAVPIFSSRMSSFVPADYLSVQFAVSRQNEESWTIC